MNRNPTNTQIEKWIAPELEFISESLPRSQIKSHKQQQEELMKQYQKAYADGFEKGYAEAKENIDRQLALCKQVVEAFSMPLHNVQQEFKEIFKALLEKTLQHLLQQEFILNPSILESIILKLIAKVQHKSNDFHIYIKESDIELIHKLKLHEKLNLPNNCFMPDPNLKSGEIRLVTNSYEYNSTIKDCLYQLFQELE